MENKSRPLCLFWTYEVSTRGDTLLMLELAAEFIALGYRIQLESPSGVLPKELHPKGAFRVRVNPHLTKLLYGKNVGGGLSTVDVMVARLDILLWHGSQRGTVPETPGLEKNSIAFSFLCIAKAVLEIVRAD